MRRPRKNQPPIKKSLTISNRRHAVTTFPSVLCAIVFRVVDIHRRRPVVAAGDYVHASTPLRSVLAFTSIAPTHAAIASVAIAGETQTHSKHQELSLKTSGQSPQNSLTFYPKHQDNPTQTP
jgi:hypothetical protein